MKLARIAEPVDEFGHEICGCLEVTELREWLTTNGTGSYASGSVAEALRAWSLVDDFKRAKLARQPGS
jgi:hypothetical protein